MIAELWKGPTAVVQGVLDPLNDALGRARQLAEICPDLQVWELQAGHCPHDEVPEQVNAALLEFAEQVMSREGQHGATSSNNAIQRTPPSERVAVAAELTS
eukprot:GHRR01025443.1.p2 GENE.GHRR01025443.1~~GHRR01025443.1.p2  ORF type:complete len:101 (+),score=36.52 GHRR01025443.1:214-516(+)